MYYKPSVKGKILPLEKPDQDLRKKEVAVIHELPLRKIRFLRQFCVSPTDVLLALDTAGKVIPPHIPEVNNLGVVTQLISRNMSAFLIQHK